MNGKHKASSVNAKTLRPHLGAAWRTRRLAGGRRQVKV